MTGVAVTGTAVWFSDRDRIEPVDVYELLAATRERSMVLRLSGGNSENVYTNFYTYAGTENATGHWLEYDDAAGTVKTNLYVVPDGSSHQVGIVTTGVLGGASETITDISPTGKKILTWGWIEATVTQIGPVGEDADPYIDDMMGTYTMNEATGVMTNHNGLSVMSYSQQSRAQDIIKLTDEPLLFIGLRPDTTYDNAPAHILGSDVWGFTYLDLSDFTLIETQFTNAISVSVSTNLSTRWVRDFDEIEKVPYRNAWTGLGPRIEKAHFDTIDNNIADMYGFARVDEWTIAVNYPYDTGLTENSTTAEVIDTAHALRILPAGMRPFVTAPTGQTTNLEEIYSRNWWAEFEHRGYGTNLAYTYDTETKYTPVIESGTWTNATYPRLNKSAMAQRYDALQNLTHATVGSVSIHTNKTLQWSGSSTNSMTEAISFAVAATPVNTTSFGSTPSRWSRTETVASPSTNHTATFRAHQAQYAVTNLYVGLSKGVSIYSAVIPRGQFHSPEGYETNGTMYTIADYVDIGTNSAHIFPPFGSLEGPTSADFSVTPGDKGWQLGSTITPFWWLDNSGPQSIIEWEFEHANTPLP